MSAKKLGTILFIVFIGALSLFVFFCIRFDLNLTPLLDDKSVKDTIRFEIIKSLLNLLVVALIGGLIAYLFRWREETQKREYITNDDLRKKEQIRIEIRIDYFKRLGIIYRNIKSARRTLRAAGLTSAYQDKKDEIKPLLMSETLLKVYKEQMEVINKYQLELEGLKIESKSLPAFINLNDVRCYLGIMEDYLREILDEFEEMCLLLNGDQPVKFTDLERLDEFTGRTTKNRAFKFSKGSTRSINYRFSESFADLYDLVIEEIGKKLGGFDN